MIYSITIAVILTVASLILKKSKVVSFLFFFTTDRQKYLEKSRGST